MICKVKKKKTFFFGTPWKMAFKGWEGRGGSVTVSSPTTRLGKHAQGLGFEKGDRIS